MKSVTKVFFSMMRPTFIFSLLLFSTLSMNSCQPLSKDSYMDSFETFINQVESNENLSSKEWTKIEQKYEKLSNELYQKYEKELSWDDKVIISKYRGEYNLMKIKRETQNIIDSFGDEK